jgi:hypothetical protein
MCTINPAGRLIERSQYAEAVEANSHRIKTEKHIYLKRQQIIEHVSGTIKRQWGYDHILLKGIEKNNGELGLIFLTYNLRRMMNILGINEVKKRLNVLFLQILDIWRIMFNHIAVKNFTPINNPYSNMIYTTFLYLSCCTNWYVSCNGSTTLHPYYAA